MPYFDTNNIRMYYELHGSGMPLMLIAGLASDSQSWLPITADLAERFSVILPDNRGVGRSTGDCSISIRLMADDCVALIRHLGLEKVSLLGHSMGGMVAMECARCYPDLIDRLLLVATTARNSTRNNVLFRDWATVYEITDYRALWFRSLITWILSERFFENQQLVDESIRYLLAYPWPQSAEAFRKQVEALADFDATGWLETISAPVKIVGGSEDILIPPVWSKQLADNIPGACLTVIEGAAHSIHSEEPQLLIREIVTFLSDITG